MNDWTWGAGTMTAVSWRDERYPLRTQMYWNRDEPGGGQCRLTVTLNNIVIVERLGSYQELTVLENRVLDMAKRFPPEVGMAMGFVGSSFVI